MSYLSVHKSAVAKYSFIELYILHSVFTIFPLSMVPPLNSTDLMCLNPILVLIIPPLANFLSRVDR